MRYSRIIEIPEKNYYYGIPLNTVEVEKDFLNKVNNDSNLKKFLSKAGIRRGDVVHFEEFGDYRTDGQYIFDGKLIIELDHETDPYGSLPIQYRGVSTCTLFLQGPCIMKELFT